MRSYIYSYRFYRDAQRRLRRLFNLLDRMEDKYMYSRNINRFRDRLLRMIDNAKVDIDFHMYRAKIGLIMDEIKKDIDDIVGDSPLKLLCFNADDHLKEYEEQFLEMDYDSCMEFFHDCYPNLWMKIDHILKLEKI